MRLLIDTNIFLEVLLNQEKAEEAINLLTNPENRELYLSDFSVHSIGIILFLRNQHESFNFFIKDMIVDAGIKILSLTGLEELDVTAEAHQFNLDFDDAYQSVIARKFDLTIVSFDSDFDRTLKGRKAPSQIK